MLILDQHSHHIVMLQKLDHGICHCHMISVYIKYFWSRTTSKKWNLNWNPTRWVKQYHFRFHYYWMMIKMRFTWWTTTIVQLYEKWVAWHFIKGVEKVQKERDKNESRKKAREMHGQRKEGLWNDWGVMPAGRIKN